MNLALPTLLILLALLPGIVFVRTYLTGRFPRRLAGVSPLSEVSLYVACAIPINALIAVVIRDRPVPWDVVAAAVTSTIQGPELRDAIARMSGRWRGVLFDYFWALVIAAIAGTIARRIVWATRIDVRLPFLQMKHRYFYTLQGRLSGYPRVVVTHADILCACPGDDGSRLYRGVIVGMEFDKDGTLTEISLKASQRGSGRGGDFKWKPIDSDLLIIPAKELHTINLRYLQVVPPRGIDRIRWEIRWWWRTLLLEG